MMTPRDRAEALVRELEIDPARDFDDLDGDAWNKLEAVITDAITEHARALLADDEATIEEMVRAAAQFMGFNPDTDWRTTLRREDLPFLMDSALAALRRKALGE